MGNSLTKGFVHKLKSPPISISYFSIANLFFKYVKGGIRYFSLSFKFFNGHLDLHVTEKDRYVAPIVPQSSQECKHKVTLCRHLSICSYI